MPIPQEILAVERPKNTVVTVYGKNKGHYSVKQRIGCKRVNGKNRPVTGPTIGHIIDSKFIPLNNDIKPVSQSDIDLKDCGVVGYADRLMKNVLDELREQYLEADAIKIYCIALLRVCYPGIKDYELKSVYEDSFLSVMYPNVALSKNSVSYFLGNLGRACSKIVSFMSSRVARVEKGHHFVID